jgi:protein-disulfide isomerase
MPSGKKSKQMRRAAATAPPPVQSKGGPRRRQADPRVLWIAAAVVVIAGIGIGLGVALSGGKKAAANVPAVGSCTNGLPGCTDVEGLFKGIPQNGLTLGAPTAKVTMTAYIDLQCPFCQQFETQVFPDIVQKYVATKKVKVVLRPWAFIGPDSSRGQAALLAAAAQNKAFNFAELLYDNQGTENTGWLSDSMVAQAASSIPGLKVPQLLSYRSSSTVKNQQKQVAAQAAADGVNQTPTIFVGPSGTKGHTVPLQSPTDETTLTKALDAALAAKA